MPERAGDLGFRWECMWCRITTRDFFVASGSHAKKACAPHRAASRESGTAAQKESDADA